MADTRYIRQDFTPLSNSSESRQLMLVWYDHTMPLWVGGLSEDVPGGYRKRGVEGQLVPKAVLIRGSTLSQMVNRAGEMTINSLIRISIFFATPTSRFSGGTVA